VICHVCVTVHVGFEVQEYPLWKDHLSHVPKGGLSTVLDCVIFHPLTTASIQYVLTSLTCTCVCGHVHAYIGHVYTVCAL
jgi:hypothetical protein